MAVKTILSFRDKPWPRVTGLAKKPSSVHRWRRLASRMVGLEVMVMEFGLDALPVTYS